MAEFQQIDDAALQRDRSVSLHEGTDQRSVPLFVSETAAAGIENFVINRIGRRSRRPGSTAFGGVHEGPVDSGSSPSPVGGGGLIDYVDNTDTDRMAAAWGSDMFSSTGDGGWAQIATGASLVYDRVHIAVPGRLAGNKALFWAGVDPDNGNSQMLVYDIENDTSTQASTAEGPGALAYFQSRAWIGIDETLLWSVVLEEAAFSAGNTLLAEPGLGGRITALVPSRDSSPKLWVFKESAVMLLEPRWGSSSALIPSAGDALDLINTNFRTLTVGAGCIAPKSAIWAPGMEGADVLFLSQDGVRNLKRASSDVQAGAGFPLSYSIPDYINRINFSQAHKACAAVFDNAYHLAVPLDGAAENSHVLRMDIQGNAWSLHDLKVRDLRSFRLGSTHRLFFQSTFSSTDTSVTEAAGEAIYQVFRGFNGTLDAGATHVPFKETSRAFIFGDAIGPKRWDALTMQFASEDTALAEVLYSVDFGPYNTLDTVAVPAGGSAIVLGEDPLPWQSNKDKLVRRQFSLSDVPPGFALQIRLQNISGASDTGQLRIYQQEVSAFPLPSDFENR